MSNAHVRALAAVRRLTLRQVMALEDVEAHRKIDESDLTALAVEGCVDGCDARVVVTEFGRLVICAARAIENNGAQSLF